MIYIFRSIKGLAWISFVIFCMYLLLSGVFLFIGMEQFYSFQKYVLSFPFLLVIPALLIISFIAGKFEALEDY